MLRTRGLIRNIEYRGNIEAFLISAVAAVLGIRLFLTITNYPTVGGHFFHISHMLWGGLLMLISMAMLLLFLDNDIKRISAVIGGLGFGTFIDEIGKFITSDNNYFYKPSFALMYITLIGFYLTLHLINRKKEFSDDEYLINSIEIMKDAVVDDLDPQEKHRALFYLSRSNPDSPISLTLQKLYKHLETIHPPQPSLLRTLQIETKLFYEGLINTRWFRRALVIFFLVQASASILIAILLLIERNTFVLPALLLSHTFTSKSFNSIHFITTLISGFFIILGIMQIYSSRIDAFRWFKRSMLVSILLSQVFAFYFHPTRAFATFLFNILILTTLNYMIDNEKSLKKVT